MKLKDTKPYITPVGGRLKDYNEKLGEFFNEFDMKSFSKGGSLIRQCLGYLEETNPNDKKFLEDGEKSFKLLSQGTHILLPEIIAYVRGDAINPALIAAVLYEKKVFTDLTTTEEKKEDFFRMIDSVMIPEPSFVEKIKNVVLNRVSFNQAYLTAANDLWNRMEPVLANKGKMTLLLTKHQCDMLDVMAKDGRLKRLNRAKKRSHR